ncbi:MAG: tetratricopeptide repeat protein [Bacteroidetes bacterium]|nr:tetratricopeptide repeat protein [Bacteroidota bacterium]
MGERFLYTPSLGFCMVVALLVGKLAPAVVSMDWKKVLVQNQPVMLLVLFITIAYSIKTFSRNPVWKDNLTLYSNDVLLSPNSTRTHYYLGNYLVKPEAWEGKSEAEKNSMINRGISELKKSVAIYPSFADSYTQMGVAYYKLNNLDSAMICYQKALELNPNFATIHNNIGTIFFTQQRFDEALKAFIKATQLDPKYAEAYANAGSAYGMLKQYDNALSYLFNAIKWDPNYAQAYFFIGLTYRFKGDENNANAYLEKAYKLDPALRPKQ